MPKTYRRPWQDSGNIVLCSYANPSHVFEARLDAVWCALLRCNSIRKIIALIVEQFSTVKKFLRPTRLPRLTSWFYNKLIESPRWFHDEDHYFNQGANRDCGNLASQRQHVQQTMLHHPSIQLCTGKQRTLFEHRKSLVFDCQDYQFSLCTRSIQHIIIYKIRLWYGSNFCQICYVEQEH